MKTVVDMDQAFLKVMVETQEWEKEFQEAFYLPIIQARATQQFLALSHADQDRLKVADPKLFKELVNNVKTLIYRMKASGAPAVTPVQLAAESPDELAAGNTESQGLTDPSALSTQQGVS